MSDKTLLQAATRAAQIGGEVLLAHLRKPRALQVDTKSEFDFVTEVDRASERAIVSFLRQNFPQHGILAEEAGNQGAAAAEMEWIIDPLDGTTNYIHGVPNFAVSVAVRRKGAVVAGAVFDPMLNEMFMAAIGEGAFLNGKRIQVSPAADLHDCLIATGFPFRVKELTDSYIRMFTSFFGKVRDIRRMGSASIDLAYVAAGRFDGFWEYRLNRWDFAASVLLIQEAGGEIGGFETSENFWESGNILASNGKVHEEMRSVIGAAM